MIVQYYLLLASMVPTILAVKFSRNDENLPSKKKKKVTSELV